MGSSCVKPCTETYATPKTKEKSASSTIGEPMAPHDVTHVPGPGDGSANVALRSATVTIVWSFSRCRSRAVGNCKNCPLAFKIGHMWPHFRGE